MASCSANGSINSSFRLELNVWENWTNNSENYSSVHWELILRSTGAYSFATIGSTLVVNVDGQVYNAYSQKSLNAGGAITIASGDKNIWHDANGNKQISFSASYTQTTTAYYTPGNMSCSGSMWLSYIPRYANFTQHYIQSKTLNSITVYWATDAARDYTQYSLNGGNWTDAGDTGTTSGSYTVKGLNPNTTYNIRTRIRRSDSQLWTESNTLTVTTYNIAKIDQANNLNIGDSYKVTYSNPSGASLRIGMYIDGSRAAVAYRSCSGSAYTFSFTQAELDTLYKLCGKSNSYKLRVYIECTQNGVKYLNYKEVTIFLTGNVMCSRVKKGNIKRAKIYIKINNSIRRAVVWKKQNGVIHRCI